MSTACGHRFWVRTRRLTGGLLVLWLAVNLLVPWFARDLNQWQAFGFPLGFWLAAEGALLVYLAIIAAYVVAMDRLEAAYLAEAAATTAGPEDPGPESA
jgi:putative solute:sodium symporter small subunit